MILPSFEQETLDDVRTLVAIEGQTFGRWAANLDQLSVVNLSSERLSALQARPESGGWYMPNQTFTSGPNGQSRICQTIGNQTVCNWTNRPGGPIVDPTERICIHEEVS